MKYADDDCPVGSQIPGGRGNPWKSKNDEVKGRLITGQPTLQSVQSVDVGAVFFDIKRAFDKVWQKGLLAKLAAAGVLDSTLCWFRDFLSNRTHQTVVGNSFSSPLAPSAGVPKGQSSAHYFS